MNARDVALAVVRDVFPAGTTSGSQRGAQEALDYRLRRSGLDARDGAFATELAYGAIKARRTLDWYLKPFIGERRELLPPVIGEILRLAVYELVYTKADRHATVFEFVNLAKRYGHRGTANLVNAVLRSFLREPVPEIHEAAFDGYDDFVGVKYSLPTWVVRQWRGTFGDSALEDICAGVNDPPAHAVTINPLQVDADAARALFAGSKRSPYVESSLLISSGAAREHERPANAGWFVQSESSAMAADILSAQPGEAVLDVCSGRGNKALQIAARLTSDGTLTCIEVDPRKASVLERRLHDAGTAAAIVVGDATADLLRDDRRFDRVLVDAPCSGVGVVGRHPEARWKKQPSDGERLSATQRALLERVSTHVYAGGVVVYAVCSTDPRETTDVVDWFLQHHNFQRGLIPGRYEPLLNSEGDVVVPPGIDGRDGFYIARLERRT